MNYICEPRDRVLDILVVNVKAEEELKAGDVVAINELVDDEENREVYKATTPAEGDIKYAIIVNQGIEELADGRRPEGQPNFTTFTFKAGTILHAVILGYLPVPYTLSNTVIEGTPVEKEFLTVVAGSKKLTAAAEKATTANLVVERTNVEIPMGGMFGMGIERATYATVL